MAEPKFNSASGATAMPPKMNTTREHTAGVSYDPMSISRRQSAASRSKSGIVDQHGRPVTKTMPGMTLEPEPTDPSVFPAEENGMAPDQVLTTNPDDAQEQHVDADPVAHEIEPAPVVPTTATAPEGGGKTEPVVDGVENTPIGSVEEARYPSLIESDFPVGYPGE
jgi:hypothetical protein